MFQALSAPNSRFFLIILIVCVSLTQAWGCKNERDRNSAGDDTRGTHVPVPLGMVVTDEISATYGDHTDWKSFAVPAPGVLAVRVYWDASDKVTNATITVHDKYGIQLAERIHDPSVAIDEVLVRVDQGFYFLKIDADRGESIYSVQAQHLLVSPSSDGAGDEDGSVPTMASVLDIKPPGAAAPAEGDAPTAAADPAAAGGAPPTDLAFMSDDSNLGILVPPDIDPEDGPRTPAPIPVPVPPTPPPAVPSPTAPPPVPVPAPPPAASMDTFSEPTGEPSFGGGANAGVGAFGAGLDGPGEAPTPPPPPAAPKVTQVEAKVLLLNPGAEGSVFLLRCDESVLVGDSGEVYDSAGKLIDKLSISDVNGAKCTAESKRTPEEFSTAGVGKVIITVPNR